MWTELRAWCLHRLQTEEVLLAGEIFEWKARNSHFYSDIVVLGEVRPTSEYTDM